jgi:hypothetical protein
MIALRGIWACTFSWLSLVSARLLWRAGFSS